MKKRGKIWFEWGWLFLIIGWIAGVQPSALAKMPMQIDSVEWTVESSDTIVRGTVRPGMIKLVRGNLCQVTIDVNETIKGEVREQIVFEAYRGVSPDNTSWMDMLVFLKHGKDEGVAANAKSGVVERFAVVHGWVFVLDEKISPVWRMDATKVDSAPALLEAVRASAAYAKKRGGNVDPMIWLSHDGLRGRSRPLLAGLVVPKDERLAEMGRRWAADDDPEKRIEAAQLLSYFPSNENILALQRLAIDPEFEITLNETWSSQIGRRAFRTFPVRQAALKVLDGDGADDQMWRMPYPLYRPLDWRLWLAGVVVIVATLALWPRQRWSMAAWGRWVSFALAVLVMVLWVRAVAGSVKEDFAFAAGGLSIDLLSTPDVIGIQRVQDGAAASGGVWRGSVPHSRLLPGSEMKVQTRFSALGIWGASGTTSGDQLYPMRQFGMPHWMLAGVLLVWPVSGFVRWLLELRRQASRKAAGRCGRCGYDLRASLRRCPECGTAALVYVRRGELQPYSTGVEAAPGSL